MPVSASRARSRSPSHSAARCLDRQSRWAVDPRRLSRQRGGCVTVGRFEIAGGQKHFGSSKMAVGARRHVLAPIGVGGRLQPLEGKGSVPAERRQHRFAELELGLAWTGQLPLAEGDQRRSGVVPLPQVGRSLRGVEQVHGLEVANAGSSRQFSRRELQSDRLAGILIERKDGHVQARHRLLDEGAGGPRRGPCAREPASRPHGGARHGTAPRTSHRWRAQAVLCRRGVQRACTRVSAQARAGSDAPEPLRSEAIIAARSARARSLPVSPSSAKTSSRPRDGVGDSLQSDAENLDEPGCAATDGISVRLRPCVP